MRALLCTLFLVLVNLWALQARQEPPHDGKGGRRGSSCRFAKDYTCEDFKSRNNVQHYLENVIYWESKFAQPGIGYDAASGYTYDGHPLNYATGELYGEPHLFSASSKESIHMGIIALALDGNDLALHYVGGREKLIDLLTLKMKGYTNFNKEYPAFGCYTPWITFDATTGTFLPLPDWMNRVPGLDNGEWFWSLYAIADMLEVQSTKDASLQALAKQYRALVDCQIANTKLIFYQGDGLVADVVNVVDPKAQPTPANYNITATTGYLNDPYEGETLTHVLYLFGDFATEEERMRLWEQKRPKLQSVQYQIPKVDEIADSRLRQLLQEKGSVITVQRGFWFSTHEQWKALLLPYVNNPDLPDVHRLFLNAEKVRTWDAHQHDIPGLMASINDVTDGSQTIPDYSSACGVPEVASQTVERRDLLTPYGSFGLFLFDKSAGLCWYNNMLRGPRMQSAFGSTEAINVNGTEISPLTTWDSKETTVLAMLGGIGHLTERALRRVPDALYGDKYRRFVHIVKSEYARVFPHESILGDHIPLATPKNEVPVDKLSDWDLKC